MSMRTSRGPVTSAATERPQAVTRTRGPLPSWYDDLLALLLAAATTYGLVVDDAYRVSEGIRADFADVMRGQDVLTALTIPVFLRVTHRARQGSLADHLVGLGLLLYYAYSYLIYAVAPYNDAFLLYVAVLGLSVFGLLDGLFRLDMGVVEAGVDASHSRGTGAFLIGVGVLFVVLWLAMLLPAIPGDLPAGRVTYDMASTVHVLDLSMVLPLVIATGAMLRRRLAVGVVLGVMVLTKIVTLGLAMLAMNLLFTDDPNPAETVMWGVIATVAAGLLVRLLGHVRRPAGAWMRGSLWH